MIQFYLFFYAKLKNLLIFLILFLNAKLSKSKKLFVNLAKNKKV
jgi:hypothetical protein